MGGKYVARVFTPDSADDWKHAVAGVAKIKCDIGPGKPPIFTMPVHVGMVFTFPRPKYHFCTNGALKVTAPDWKTSKPDIDNLMKSTLDALTTVGVLSDDKIVVSVSACKSYGITFSGCLITVKEAQ